MIGMGEQPTKNLCAFVALCEIQGAGGRGKNFYRDENHLECQNEILTHAKEEIIRDSSRRNLKVWNSSLKIGLVTKEFLTNQPLRAYY
jgi:hypothetical protein